MDILRHMPATRDRFTILDNAVLRDKRLSYRARGVLGALLSHRDGFQVTSESLAAGSPKEGRDAIRNALTELADAGYLRRPRRQDPLTGLWGTHWLVFPEGDAVAWDGTQPDPVSAGQTGDGFPGVGSSDPPRTDDGFSGAGPTWADATNPQVTPTTGKPTVGEPAVGEPGANRSTSQKNQEKSGQVSSYLTVGDAPATPDPDLTDDAHDTAPPAPVMPASLAALRGEAFRDVPPEAVPDDTDLTRDLLRQAVTHGWTGATIRDAITADRHNYGAVGKPAGLVVKSLRRIATLPAPAAPAGPVNEAVCDECSRTESQCRLAAKTDPAPHAFRAHRRGRIVNGHWESTIAADDTDTTDTADWSRVAAEARAAMAEKRNDDHHPAAT